MKLDMKKICIPALVATALLVSSCNDWTQTEGLDFSRPTPEQQDPAKHQSYLKSLRDYKLRNYDEQTGAEGYKYPVMMITVAGVSKAPGLQNQHLTAMPDSVDYICMTNAVDLHPTVVREISKVYATKGTRTLCVVDYTIIDEAWKLMQEEKEEAGLADDGGTEAADFAAYCKEQTLLQLSCCDQYGFAGIEISYLGKTTTDVERSGQLAFMECVTEWRQTHGEKLMFFRGYTRNLLDNSILADCDYIVLLAGTSSSASQLTIYVKRQLGEGVPADRFIMEVAIPTLADPTQVGATAKVAAQWTLLPETDFSKQGVAVSNAQDDYYRIDMIYRNIRQAMAILSPAPNN